MRRLKLAHKDCMSSTLVGCNTIMASYDVAYCAETSVWTAKKTMGDSPKALSSSGVVHDNNLYVFGGVLNGEAQNNLHCLDIGE